MALAGYDGKRELHARQVPDPYDGQHLMVIINTRESPLDHLLNRGIINEAQKHAGDRFRKIYERSIVGGAKAIDYRKPKVDGGVSYDPMETSLQEAAKALKWICGVVGEYDYRLLVRIAGEGQSIKDQAPDWPLPLRKRAELYVGQRFRDALGLLARRWGFAETA